ncbi:MAG: hypothetical protein J5777_02740, partial [Clostridiales bacterium]|nr:hypothetical protein [Clostridiales bacterium]
MFRSKFKNKIAAAAVLGCMLLSSCANKNAPAQSQGGTSAPGQTAATAESSDESKGAPESTAKPLDLDEDLSKYDLKDDDSLEQIASKMEAKYGIDIVYGNDIRTEFVDENETIRAAKFTNEKDIAIALRSINEGLNCLPKGFIQQLPYGKHKILKMYLTGTISIVGISGGTIPAFTSDSDDELYLTVEILDQGVVNVPTVLHELTHIVDFKLKHDGLLKDEEWAKLNPEGFAYSESYADNMAGKKNSENCYCTDHYVPHNTNCASDDIWFYYSYSKVNAYEDRATALEDLIIYKLWNYEVAPDLYKSPHMKAKAEYFLKLVEKDFKMTDSDKEAWK